MTPRKPMPGETVTYHRVTSLDPEAPIEDTPALVKATTFIEDRDTPILVIEIVLPDGTKETLGTVSHASEHPELADKHDAAIRAHTARRGYWS